MAGEGSQTENTGFVSCHLDNGFWLAVTCFGQSIVADQSLVKAGDAFADNCLVQPAEQAAQFGQLKFRLSK